MHVKMSVVLPQTQLETGVEQVRQKYQVNQKQARHRTKHFAQCDTIFSRKQGGAGLQRNAGVFLVSLYAQLSNPANLVQTYQPCGAAHAKL